MKTKKQYCEENGLDIDRVFDMCVSGDEGVLAVRGAFTGYFAEITDTSVICTNEKLGIRKEIPFADFMMERALTIRTSPPTRTTARSSMRTRLPRLATILRRFSSSSSGWASPPLATGP